MRQQVDLEEPETPLSAYQHGVATPRRNNLIQVTWAILINTHFFCLQDLQSHLQKKIQNTFEFSVKERIVHKHFCSETN
jgi:hypothetical protein